MRARIASQSVSSTSQCGWVWSCPCDCIVTEIRRHECEVCQRKLTGLPQTFHRRRTYFDVENERKDRICDHVVAGARLPPQANLKRSYLLHLHDRHDLCQSSMSIPHHWPLVEHYLQRSGSIHVFIADAPKHALQMPLDQLKPAAGDSATRLVWKFGELTDSLCGRRE